MSRGSRIALFVRLFQAQFGIGRTASTLSFCGIVNNLQQAILRSGGLARNSRGQPSTLGFSRSQSSVSTSSCRARCISGALKLGHNSAGAQNHRSAVFRPAPVTRLLTVCINPGHLLAVAQKFNQQLGTCGVGHHPTFHVGWQWLTHWNDGHALEAAHESVLRK